MLRISREKALPFAFCQPEGYTPKEFNKSSFSMDGSFALNALLRIQRYGLKKKDENMTADAANDVPHNAGPEDLAAAQQPSARKKRVLIIEDEDSASKFLGLRLKKLGFDVSAAADGMAGLQEVMSTLPDLVILDLMLPKLPGEEVCKAIRESFDEQIAKIPVIMLTGKDSVVDKVLGKVIGADAYLTKPYDFNDLLAAIRRIIPEIQT